jgi:hypothetical protein
MKMCISRDQSRCRKFCCILPIVPPHYVFARREVLSLRPSILPYASNYLLGCVPSVQQHALTGQLSLSNGLRYLAMSKRYF